MALQSPASTDSSPHRAAPLQQPDTAPLDLASYLPCDSLLALDHRSLRRALRPAEAPAGHYLAVEDSAGARMLIPIEDKVTHVGRAATADLRFEEPHVSRRHAIIVRYGRHVRVLDDRSSEGTFVNGTRIVATDLLDGDVVRLGPVSLTYTVVR